MKKMWKQISALALTGLMGLAAVGCGGSTGGNSSTGGGTSSGGSTTITLPSGDQDFQVYIINHGYRTEGAEAILNAFKEQDWVKAKYPNLKITPTSNNMSGFALNKVQSPKTNEFDLMFVLDDMIKVYEKNSKGENLLLDLTEVVYNSEVLDKPGTKYIDTIHDSFLQYLAYTTKTETTPKYYGVPWVTGYSGILYSEEILARYGYTDGKTPNTTDEFLALCENIKTHPENSGNTDGYCFINASSYYHRLLDTWWAQYDGLEAYNNFWQGKYTDARGTSYSNKIFSLEGRLKALEVIAETVYYENGYYDLKNQDAGDFMTRQATLLKGQYAFMACPDWYDTEMRSTKATLEAEGIDTHTIKIMQMPIISAITDKLDTVKDDATLSKVVEAIDNGATSYEGVSAKDFARLQEARGIYDQGGMEHEVVIPTSADDQDIAVDVLKFMATKTAQEAYMKATMGQNMPFDYDYANMPTEVKSELSPLQISRLDYYYTTDYAIHVLPIERRFPLVRNGGLRAFTGQTSGYNVIFSIENCEETPLGMFNDTKKYWTDQVFNFALMASGLR